MQSISNERLVSGGFIAAMAMSVLLGGIVWYSAVRFEQAAVQAAHSRQVLALISQLNLSLVHLDAELHGYAMPGSKDGPKRRNESLMKVIYSVEQAERVVTAAEQSELLRQVKRLAAQRLSNSMQDAVMRKSDSGGVEAGTGDLLPVMAQTYYAFEQIMKAENASLQENSMDGMFHRNVEYASLILLALLLTLMLFILHGRVRREMRQAQEDREARLRYSRLEHEFRLKSEFMAHTSHELRTPLNAIIGFSELFKDGLLGKLDKVQAEYISDIYDSAEHLLSLVNNILDLSKIEAGRMTLDLQQAEISELFDSCMALVRGGAVSRHIHLHLDVQAGLDGNYGYVDAVKTKQILLNLLSNAVKFTPDGGQVKLCTRRVPRQEAGKVSGSLAFLVFPLEDNGFEEFLEINVFDSGIGIARDAMSKLFQPYGRIDSGLSHAQEGTGLGLVLVKRLAELHGGTVAVESVEGRGSRFVVWLPLRKGPAQAAGKTIPGELQRSIGKALRLGAKAVCELGRQRTFINA